MRSTHSNGHEGIHISAKTLKSMKPSSEANALGKSMVLVATETDGRLRLAHALTNDEETLKAFADANLAADASVTSDGHADYNATSLSERTHEAIVQTNAERAVSDTLQRAHWSVSMLKRWLIGTHAGAIKARHLQAYLDEFAFRWNRRKTNGVGRISARTIETLVLTSRTHHARHRRRRQTLPSVHTRRIRVAGCKGTGMVTNCPFNGAMVRTLF